MANSTTDKQNKMTMIHSAIGVAIMVLFRFLPLQLPEVTPIGMQDVYKRQGLENWVKED